VSPQVVRYSERPELWESISSLSDEVWPEYNQHGDISERLGDQAGLAATCHNLGYIVYLRGDYDEAARQYQRSLEIEARLGDQAGLAATYSQVGLLEAERPDGSAAAAVGWHVKALLIRLRLGTPQAVYALRRLAVHRRELGSGSLACCLRPLAIPG